METPSPATTSHTRTERQLFPRARACMQTPQQLSLRQVCIVDSCSTRSIGGRFKLRTRSPPPCVLLLAWGTGTGVARTCGWQYLRRVEMIRHVVHTGQARRCVSSTHAPRNYMSSGPGLRGDADPTRPRRWSKASRQTLSSSAPSSSFSSAPSQGMRARMPCSHPTLGAAAAGKSKRE